ncbi:uncharacterized protein LOC133037683 [Cannabis sativa]|uniref:uncharacterized protein LOC133037683 n=1 Tax=Cannabis sativa TaxID=3483 RepID=UPI0029CA98F2|nr:uncharacterized protein LOC133037683 [Cannabis sativa]
MIIQEERQRSLGSSEIVPFAAASSSTNPPRAKKPRPSCSNCGKPGHLVDKCYFLHGFPPGYGDKKKQDKGKGKANTASTHNPKPENDHQLTHADITSHCQHLISLLSQQLGHTSNAENPASNPAISNHAGSYSECGDWDS